MNPKSPIPFRERSIRSSTTTATSGISPPISIRSIALDRSRRTLTLESFGLGDEQLDETFDPGVLPLENPATLRSIIDLLESTYCRHIGAEYMHIQDREKRRWLQKRMEGVANQPPRSDEDRIRLLEMLASADAFETFLQTRYVGKKRFGIEGGESLIPLLDTIVELAPANGINEFVMGMSHRGRLNVLCNILGKTYGQLFTEFAESWEEDFIAGTGDVKYHGSYSSDRTTRSGQKVRLALASNPEPPRVRRSHRPRTNPREAATPRRPKSRAGRPAPDARRRRVRRPGHRRRVLQHDGSRRLHRRRNPPRHREQPDWDSRPNRPTPSVGTTEPTSPR